MNPPVHSCHHYASDNHLAPWPANGDKGLARAIVSPPTPSAQKVHRCPQTDKYTAVIDTTPPTELEHTQVVHRLLFVCPATVWTHVAILPPLPLLVLGLKKEGLGTPVEQ